MSTFTITIESYDDILEKIRVKPKKGATNPDPKRESGQPIIFDVILDVSGSMAKYYDDLVFCFNTIMIRSLKEASERFKGPMRLGCLLFSEKLIPAWQGFRTLEELGKEPLKRKLLDQPGLGSTTALFGAMRSGVLWTAASMQHMHDTSVGSEFCKGKVIILSDGANNRPPMDEKVVMDTLESIGRMNKKNLQPMVGFFDTNDGLTRSRFDAMVKKTGFQGCGFYEIAKGVSDEEKRKSFRHFFQIFSSQATNL